MDSKPVKLQMYGIYGLETNSPIFSCICLIYGVGGWGHNSVLFGPFTIPSRSYHKLD